MLCIYTCCVYTHVVYTPAYRPVLVREAHGDWVDSTILVLRFIKGISIGNNNV